MPSDKPSNESISFRVAVVLVSGVGIAVTGTNIGYYNRILDEDANADCNLISNSEARTAWWINLIALIIFAIIFIWALISGPMSISRRKRMEDERARDYVQNNHVKFDPANKHSPLVREHDMSTRVISSSRPVETTSTWVGHGRGSSVTVSSPTVLNIQSPRAGGVTYPDLG